MTIAALILALIAAPQERAGRDPVLLDFHADWCGPCQTMRPAVAELVRKGYPVKSIDIDDDAETAARYEVTSVPTFIVTDAEGKVLARTQGSQPAEKLASLYIRARTQARPRVQTRLAAEDDEVKPEDLPAEDGDDAIESDRPTAANPKPWETVVRINVHGNNMLGLGSGTVISSTPEESIILTCAHIFHIEGIRRQYPPSQFPRRLTVDLFDGVPHEPRNHTVHPKQTVEGEAIDYDFVHDVGLIRIKPGRRLPASRVVPADWRPRARLPMITVGCSHGHDATAWSTSISNPRMSGPRPDGRGSYEGVECVHAPKQGRSGGGLYTTDGFVAGVCDFADPYNNRGIYASPDSIHAMLNKNGLKRLYAPIPAETEPLLAKERTAPKNRPSREITLRAQNPTEGAAPKVITVPRPEILGIEPPALASNQPKPRSAEERHAWQSSRASTPVGEPVAESPAADQDPGRREPTRRLATDLKRESDSDLDSTDSFSTDPDPIPAPIPPRPKSAGKWRAVSPHGR